MNFNDENLHDRVEQLEDDLSRAEGTCESLADENVELHERVEQLERHNAILQADMDDYRGRWMARGSAIAEQKERIGELESLVRDMWFKNIGRMDSCGWCVMGCDDPEDCSFYERMAALGLLEGGERPCASTASAT